MKDELFITASGNKCWYLDDKLHREDGPAVEYIDGSKEWYLGGKLHREDKPAVENTDGTKFWWVNGRRHREDGPAVEFADGTKAWWLNDKFISNELPENWEELVKLAQVKMIMEI
jgi:hypothetical protein